jgi:hypothetical protein
VLVRSIWRADVRILAREPEFEIEHRWWCRPRWARGTSATPTKAATRIHLRALVEAGLGT